MLPMCGFTWFDFAALANVHIVNKCTMSSNSSSNVTRISK